jgi:hypothetical protein
MLSVVKLLLTDEDILDFKNTLALQFSSWLENDDTQH